MPSLSLLAIVNKKRMYSTDLIISLTHQSAVLDLTIYSSILAFSHYELDSVCEVFHVGWRQSQPLCLWTRISRSIRTPEAAAIPAHLATRLHYSVYSVFIGERHKIFIAPVMGVDLKHHIWTGRADFLRMVLFQAPKQVAECAVLQAGKGPSQVTQ